MSLGYRNYRISTTKALLSLLVILSPLAVLLYANSQPAGNNEKKTAAAEGGGGVPGGVHYSLNLSGSDKNKADMANAAPGTIYVSLSSDCRINLYEGAFSILDRNCQDGTSSFQLPDIGTLNNTLSYAVWIKAIRAPSESEKAVSCATDPVDGALVCSLGNSILLKSQGTRSFIDISSDLLYTNLDLAGKGVVERFSIFDPKLQGFFWEPDNSGQKLAQIRFYSAPSASK